MKNILLIISIISLFSCIYEDYEKAKKWYIVSFPIQFQSVDECVEWVYDNISYEMIEDRKLQLPSEIMISKKGNCIERALLIMAIVYSQKRIKGTFVCVVNYRDKLHAVVEYNDHLYCDGYKNIEWKISFDYMCAYIMSEMYREILWE